jgi:hypothetical protein
MIHVHNEQIALRLLQDAIQSNLSSAFKVNANFLTTSLDDKIGNADLVIWPEDRVSPFIVEYKGVRENASVPMSAVSQLLRIARINGHLRPRLVLATTGKVNSLLADEARFNNVAVVQTEDLSEMSRMIANVVRQSETRRHF